MIYFVLQEHYMEIIEWLKITDTVQRCVDVPKYCLGGNFKVQKRDGGGEIITIFVKTSIANVCQRIKELLVITLKSYETLNGKWWSSWSWWLRIVTPWWSFKMAYVDWLWTIVGSHTMKIWCDACCPNHHGCIDSWQKPKRNISSECWGLLDTSRINPNMALWIMVYTRPIIIPTIEEVIDI